MPLVSNGHGIKVLPVVVLVLVLPLSLLCRMSMVRVDLIPAYGDLCIKSRTFAKRGLLTSAQKVSSRSWLDTHANTPAPADLTGLLIVIITNCWQTWDLGVS